MVFSKIQKIGITKFPSEKICPLFFLDYHKPSSSVDCLEILRSLKPISEIESFDKKLKKTELKTQRCVSSRESKKIFERKFFHLKFYQTLKIWKRFSKNNLCLQSLLDLSQKTFRKKFKWSHQIDLWWMKNHLRWSISKISSHILHQNIFSSLELCVWWKDANKRFKKSEFVKEIFGIFLFNFFCWGKIFGFFKQKRDLEKMEKKIFENKISDPKEKNNLFVRAER